MAKKLSNSYFFIGLLGGVVVIALLLVYILFSESFNYKLIYILNPEVQIETLKELDIITLSKLQAQGVLCTPDQYANNIASYYNTFVAFLTILFVVFSFLSYLSIKNISKTEIETNVEIALRDMLRDSITFRQTILNSIYGKFEENFISSEDFSSEIKIIELELEKLKEAVGMEDNGSEKSEELE